MTAALRRFAIAAVLLLGGCGRDSTPIAPVPGEDPLAQAAGQWLLINYWAEWCKPCIEEIPQLNEFAARHAARVRVLMVNYDGVTGNELRAQAERLGIATPLLESDPSPRLGVDPPQVLPTTYVVDPDGRLRETLIGPQTVASLEKATSG